MSELKIRLSYLVLALTVYSCGFLAFTWQQMPNYFEKDLVSYDEATNAVVSANLTRERFPPRLRPNSLTQEYQGWKEGPDWQHIPPLFLYVPYPFYQLDGDVHIETRRLAYVAIAWLQGAIFLIGLSFLYRQKRAIMAGVLASWLWMLTPFVRGVLTGNYFGYSDIVLSCSVTLAFIMVLGYYFHDFKSREGKRQWLYFAILACTLPLLVKNMLGALPLALLLVAIAATKERENVIRSANIFRALSIPMVICGVYYGLNFIASPEAFKASFFVSWEHFGDFEGWKKPWHYFVSSYLPGRYFTWLTWPFVAALAGAVYLWTTRDKGPHRWLTLSFLVYFTLNLIAVSAVTSKSPNFILQGYLFLLFFVAYVLINQAMVAFPALKFSALLEWLYGIRRSVIIIIAVVFATFLYFNLDRMVELRRSEYVYQTPNEKFFQFGELSRDVLYAGTRTLFILDTDTLEYADTTAYRDPDFWMRYYILYNTGSEARRMEEVRAFTKQFNVGHAVAQRYDQIYLVSTPDARQARYPDLNGRFTRLGYFEILSLNRNELMELLAPRGDNG